MSNKVDKLYQNAIDDIVKTIDYDIWKDGYNKSTAEEPEYVETNRRDIEMILQELVDSVANLTNEERKNEEPE